MHLTNSQLLDNNIQSNAHLLGCHICQQRQLLLQQYQQHMDTQYEQLETFDFSTAQQKLFSDPRLNVQQPTKYWQKLSLAASIGAIALLLFLFRTPATLNEHNNTSQLIAEANQLSVTIRQLIEQDMSDYFDWRTISDIEKVDVELQQAYLHNANEQSLDSLWLQKIALLNQQIKFVNNQQKNLQNLEISI